ncbi:MAG: DUF6788 family protein [Bryobacteraceae bacterium]
MTRKQVAISKRKLLSQLPPLEDLLRGSLLERHTFHPSSISCATCASGEGHLQFVLNVNYPGAKTRQLTVHPDHVPHVRRQLANLQRVREILESVCELNQQLLLLDRAEARQKERES